jgi:hypothetical protein
MDQASTNYGVIIVVAKVETIGVHFTQYIMIVSCAGPLYLLPFTLSLVLYSHLLSHSL